MMIRDINIIPENYEWCGCYGCQSRKSLNQQGHWSSCAVHNEPAMPNGECDCVSDDVEV